MSIKKIIIYNLFTSAWVFVFVLGYIGYLLGWDYYGHYEWQKLGWFIHYYIGQYIVWPCDILFVTKEGAIRIDVFWARTLGSIISLATYIVADFLLRRLLWRKIEKRKLDRKDPDSTVATTT